jgi:hypothetical protein
MGLYLSVAKEDIAVVVGFRIQENRESGKGG